MTGQTIGLVKAFVAKADIQPNRIVKLHSDGTVSSAGGDTDALIGVSYPEVTAVKDSNADIILSGVVKIRAGAAVSAGAWVSADSNGKAVATTSGGKNIIGRALNAASGADEIIPVIITIGQL